MDSKKDRTATDSAPDSTWGATREAKAQWQDKHGKADKADKADRTSKSADTSDKEMD